MKFKNYSSFVFVTLFVIFFTVKVNSQVMINEYSCSNFSGITDNFGNTPDWLELYNAGASSVNLAGYYLSDNVNNPTKWAFPAGVNIAANGVLRIWASGVNTVSGTNIHTNFKLTQTKPEGLAFSNPSGVILDSMTLMPALSNHSRGRITNGSATWGVFTTPTPNTANANAKLEYATRPAMSIPAGYYAAAQSVTISSPDPLITIRYTTDGSIPTATSAIYSTPIAVSATTVLRAKAFSSNAQVPSSFVESNTYFINVNHTIPVVSIFGGSALQSLMNGNQSFPETGLEYFDVNHILKAETEGASNEHGNDSWAYQQRGIDFIADDELGYNYGVNTKLFINKSRQSFQRIILKCSANDNYPFSTSGACHIRDQYVHTISQRGNLHVDERTWSPCIVYVNGQYWGVYDLREKVTDSDFTDYYYHQAEDSVQMLMTWGGTWSQYGGAQAQTDWNTLKNYITSNNMTIAANYNYVKSQFNVESLADYVILNSWAVTSDWLNWNTGWWRGLAYNGQEHKWRYVLWDNDATFGHYINYTGVPNTTPSADPCDPQTLSDPGGQGHIPILNALFTNPDFKEYYENRYIDLMNTTLNCNYAIPLLDSMIATIQPEMTGQISRWGGNMTTWQNNVLAMRNFIIQRCADIQQGLIDCYTLTGPYTVKYNVTPVGAGTIGINSITPPSYVFTGTYYGNIQTHLMATANTGYTFDHWQLITNTVSPANTSDTVALSFTANDSIVAVFVPITTAPTASFSGTPTTICENDSVTFTDASSGVPTSWSWTFTGGTPSSFIGQNPPSIHYTTSGNYDVSLIVTNAYGTNTSTITNYITVNVCTTSPTPVFNGSPTSICQNGIVTFTDASTGNPTTWNWTFTGGTPATFNGQTPPPISYASAGTYAVTLTTSNINGGNTSTLTNYITVNVCVAPTSTFSGTPTTICVNNTVTFTDASTGNPTAWNWTFTGGTPGTFNGQNPPPISYAVAGTYPVSLTVTNAYGTNTSTFNNYITVNGCVTPPTPVFSGTPTTICENGTVTFTDASTNAPTSWNWIFTGGTPGTFSGQNPPPITYALAGTYPVTLTVSNAGGSNSNTQTNYITVNVCVPPPNPLFSGTPTTICENGTVIFSDASTGSPTSWNWTFTGGTPGTFNGQNPPPISYATAGTYLVSLTVTNAGGSNIATFNNYITVNVCITPPVANFTGTPVAICEDDSVLYTDASTGPTSWSWIFTGGIPLIYNGQNPPPVFYSSAGIYPVSLTVSNGGGSDTKTITDYIVVGNCPPPIDIPPGDAVSVPSGFSPNGDGHNDILHVLGDVMELDFAVYNRWGQRVFQTSNPKIGWDGTFEGKELNAGVFGYRLSATRPNGEKVELKGNITLVK